jgi:chaperonin GroEL (HSP60 family)
MEKRKIDSNTICKGYNLAKDYSIKIAKKEAEKITSFENLSKTALSTKLVRVVKEKFIEISLLTQKLSNVNNLKMKTITGKTLKGILSFPK